MHEILTWRSHSAQVVLEALAAAVDDFSVGADGALSRVLQHVANVIALRKALPALDDFTFLQVRQALINMMRQI